MTVDREIDGASGQRVTGRRERYVLSHPDTAVSSHEADATGLGRTVSTTQRTLRCPPNERVTEMAYTVNGVADRIKEMDFDASAWKRYTALCTLAHLRGTPKKVVVARVFGQGKESSSFKGAWTISSNFFASYVSTDEQEAIRAMNLDEATKRTMDLMQGHMDELGVKGKNEYALVAKYATKTALDKATADEKARLKADEAEKEAADAAAKEVAAAAEAAAQAAATATPDIDVVDTAVSGLANANDDEVMNVITSLLPRVSTDNLAAFYKELGAYIANRQDAEAKAELLKAA